MRIKLHAHQQQEGQSAQDYLTELRTVADAAKAVDSPQGVGTTGEAFPLVEKMFQERHSTPPPSFSDD